MAQMQVFVSHSHDDAAFCRAIVEGLRDAGADVWYDEHNMGSGELGRTIEQEVRRRPVFVVILSPAALHSRWVEDETRWAYRLYRDRPDDIRIIQPVTAVPLDRDDIWLFLGDFHRIEDNSYQPFPVDEAIRRLLHSLALSPRNAPSTPNLAETDENAIDLVARGRGLHAQQRYDEAISLFRRAIQLSPDSAEAWVSLGLVLNDAGYYADALPANDAATQLAPGSPVAWNNKGFALNELKRYEEALAALDRSLTLDTNVASIWNNRANALLGMSLHAQPQVKPALLAEALHAYDRALALDPAFAHPWSGKGAILNMLGRFEDALAALNRALQLDPNVPITWTDRGNALLQLGRYEDALISYDQALRFGDSAVRWQMRAITLHALGRTTEAEAAERRAKELGR